MERILIGSIETSTTKAGKPIIDLFAADTRLSFPVLRLFDLSALITVGLDPNDLPAGRHVIRFYAYYTESEKTNERGNPYKDISHLELIDTPATTASTDTTALLAEMREIKAMLAQVLNTAPPETIPDPQPEPPPTNPATGEIENGVPPVARYADGSEVSDNVAEQQAFGAYTVATGELPASLAALRKWVSDTPKPKPADTEGFD